MAQTIVSAEEPAVGEVQPTPGQGGLSLRLSISFKQLLREPLVHFLLIGVALFAFSSVLNRGSSQGASSRQIDLTVDDLRQLEIAFASQWQRSPTPQEFTGLVESRVREEVLYREALAMGLDKDDTIVKRRMAQKMEFLAEDVANAHEPSIAELKAWFQNNGQRFALPSRATFRHLYFSPDRRAQHAQDDAVKALAKLSGKPRDLPLTATLSDPFMFQDYYGDRAPDQLAKEFGPAFAEALFKLKPGAWQGPIESGYGWHLIWIDSFAPGRIPTFEEVEPDVKTAWLADQREQAWRKAYQTMRAKYVVLLPAPPMKETASTVPASKGTP
jgi:peptidyl-prolyl cis-trans isomerase C